MQLANGYDRHKVREILTFRLAIFDEVADATAGQEFWICCNDSLARRVRVSSQVKRWKTRPRDLSVAVKFGMYESFRVEFRDGTAVSNPALLVQE